MTRHEIQVLRAAGIPERTVATRTGASVRSVRRVAKEPAVTQTIPGTSAGRPSVATPWTGRSSSG